MWDITVLLLSLASVWKISQLFNGLQDGSYTPFQHLEEYGSMPHNCNRVIITHILQPNCNHIVVDKENCLTFWFCDIYLLYIAYIWKHSTRGGCQTIRQIVNLLHLLSASFPCRCLYKFTHVFNSVNYLNIGYCNYLYKKKQLCCC